MATKKKPLASHALFGITGKRTGTRFIYEIDEAWANRHQPYFRWTRAGDIALAALSAGGEE